MAFPGFRISILSVAREPRARISRYETIIATLVGVSALFVSGYTAYVQRQQVRAAVWPILEYDTSDDPMIRFTLHNKGVGPGDYPPRHRQGRWPPRAQLERSTPETGGAG